MKDRKHRRGLKGAVLVMILTVMFVLIILLMATLTVVTSANQRIYTKFEENQAYYTARSALDIFTQDMLEDHDYYAYGSSGIRQYKYTYEDVTVTPSQMKISANTNMKQGLALQHELYKIKSQSETYGGTLGFAENATANDKIFYTVLNGVGAPAAMPENDFYTVHADTSNVPDLDYIEYKVTLPAVKSSAADDYGRIVDKDASGEQIAKIKVEVLSRVFNTNPAYTPAEIQTIIGGTDLAAKQSLKDAIRDGERGKDQIRLKITSTVEFANTVGTAVLIYDSKSIINNFQRALTMFSDSGAADSINIIGDTAVGAAQEWTNDSIIYGNFYSKDGLSGLSGAPLSNGPDIHVTAGESVFIGDDFNVGNDHFRVTGYGVTPPPVGTPVDKSKRPFLFVDGDYICTNKVIHGGTTSTDGTISGEEIDFIVSKNLKVTGSDLTVNGDVYVAQKLDLSAMGGGKLTIDGDLYVGGDCDISSVQNGFTVTGDIYINGDFITGTRYFSLSDDGSELTVIGGANIGGNIYLGTKINGNVIPGGTLTGYQKQTISFSMADNDNTTEVLDLALPSGVIKAVPTHSSNFNDYYMKDANGNLILSGGSTVRISAEQKAFTDSADFAVGKYTPKPFTAASFGVASATAVTNSTSTITGPGVYRMSASGGYNLNISGGGTVNILMEAGTYGGTILVSDDKTTVNFYGESVGTYQLFNLYVYNNDTFAAKGGGVLNVGNRKNCGIRAPKINYYFSGSSIIDFYNGAFLTGYIYAPGATVKSNSSGTNLKMNYNGNPVNDSDGDGVSNGASVNLVGAVLCDKLQYQNSNNGLAYINPELKADDGGGEPPLEWKTYQYKRD